jgi:hypothetical protein
MTPQPADRPFRKRLLPLRLLCPAALALLLCSCGWDGHFTIGPYTTRPNYDSNIKTVKVNIVQNPSMWRVVPVVGLEEQLTKEIVDQIQKVTPWRVVQSGADTELVAMIRSFTLANTVYNQLNERREGEATMVVELRWRDLRTGEMLSRPAPRAMEGVTTTPPLLPGQSNPLAMAAGLPNPQTPISTPESPLSNSTPANMSGGAANQSLGLANTTTPGMAPPAAGGFVLPGGPPGVFVRSITYFRPELGQSLTSAQAQGARSMAVQIVSLMEKGW